MSNKVQTTGQLCSLCILGMLCSKSFKLGFNSMWTEKFQMYKLDLENSDEAEIKLLTFIWSNIKQGIPETMSLSSTRQKPLTLWITTNYWKFLKWWECQTTLPVSWEKCMWVKKKWLETYIELNDSFKIGKGVQEGCVVSPCLCKMAAWMNHKLQSRLLEETAEVSLRSHATLMVENKEELKSLLMTVKSCLNVYSPLWCKKQDTSELLALSLEGIEGITTGEDSFRKV